MSDNINHDALAPREDEAGTAMSSSSSARMLSSPAEQIVLRQNLCKLKLPFPWKLHQLLDDADGAGFEDIVSWLPGGHAFRVHQPEVFSKKIMTQYFQQTKFSSFTRQLYIYGFTKIEGSEDHGGYFHPQFNRESKSASMTLSRNTHNDRRLRKHYSEREDSSMRFRAARAKRAPGTSPKRRGATKDCEDVNKNDIENRVQSPGVEKETTRDRESDKKASIPTSATAEAGLQMLPHHKPAESSSIVSRETVVPATDNDRLSSYETSQRLGYRASPSSPTESSLRDAQQHQQEAQRKSRDSSWEGVCGASGDMSRAEPNLRTTHDSFQDDLWNIINMVPRMDEQCDLVSRKNNSSKDNEQYSGLEPRSIEEMVKDALW